MARPVPAVTYEDAPLPYWARWALGRAKRELDHPDCLFVARVQYRYQSLRSVPACWHRVLFTADNENWLALPTESMHAASATGLSSGRHTVIVEPKGKKPRIGAAKLDLHRGTVVLVDVQPDTKPWAGGRPASVQVRVLTSGLSLNGRWGRRWAHRLGWDGPPPDRDDGIAPLSSADTPPPLPAEPLKPAVMTENGTVPFWARRIMWRELHDVDAWDCLVVARVRYLPARGYTVAAEWALVLVGFGDQESDVMGVLQDQPGFAAGVAAGTRTVEVLPSGLEGFVAPVTLDLERGAVVLIDVWPRHERWVSRRPPSAQIRVLTSALSGGGRWEARWRRRLGWEDQGAAPGLSGSP